MNLRARKDTHLDFHSVPLGVGTQAIFREVYDGHI